MKKCWSLFIPLTLMSLNFLGFILYAQPARIDHKSDRFPAISYSRIAHILGDVYVLSNPLNDPNELLAYVQNQPEYFGENGVITLAAKDLGNWILENNVMELEEDCLAKINRHLKHDDISRDYASQLLSGIKRSNFNCELIANDLIWLSENLPLIAEGDLKSYLYSGADIRLQLKEILPLFETMQISDPEIAEIILNDKNCYHQKMADQIQLMALISKSNK
jgi:hypothetical protein